MILKFSFLRLVRAAEIGEVSIETDDVSQENITRLLKEKQFKTYLTTDIEIQEDHFQFLPFVEGEKTNVKSVT